MQLVVQFIDLRSRLIQSLLAGRRDCVDPATMPPNISDDRLQQAAALETMQKGVKSSRPDTITVMGQFLHHCKPKNGFMGSMYQDMNSDEAEEELLLLIGHSTNIPSV